MGSRGMLGYSFLQQIKELEITSWPGFPSEIGRTDIVGGNWALGHTCPGRMIGLAFINPLPLEPDIEGI